LNKNTYDFSTQTAVVTGGCNGIGAAVTERLIDSAANVAVWDMDISNPESRVVALGDDRCRLIEVDVSNLDSVESAMSATESAFSKVDILINCAGIAGPTSSLVDYPETMWRKVQAVNVDGTYHCCKAVIPGMVARDYGRVVNVASIAGKEGNPNASAYSVSKAAVIALTKSLGKELAEHNIAVNCITPAAAKTRIFDQISQEFVDYMLSKRIASAENSFTTGAAFDLSGGRATY